MLRQAMGPVGLTGGDESLGCVTPAANVLAQPVPNRNPGTRISQRLTRADKWVKSGSVVTW